MKLIEKLYLEHPDLKGLEIDGDIIGCPNKFGYDNEDYKVCEHMSCEECWDREIPEEHEENKRKEFNVNGFYVGDYVRHKNTKTEGRIKSLGKEKACVGDHRQNIWIKYCNLQHAEPPKENVNHPSHYQGKNECIDVMLAMFGVEAVKHFCMCNAYKYRFRSTLKNGDEDIRKAEWYESKLIELGGVDNVRDC